MKIEKNVGKKDRMIRYAVAGALVVLTLMGVLHGLFGLVAIVAAVLLALSATFKTCFLYRVLGKSTCCGGCQVDDTPEV